MKKVLLLALSFVLLIAYSCDNDSEEPNTPEVAFIDVPIPDKYLAQNCEGECEVTIIDIAVQKDNIEVFGKARITTPIGNNDKIIQFEVSENIINDTSLDPNFWINIDTSPHRTKGSCIAECQKEFTNKDGSKKKGRGWCKAGCWAETAAKVAAVVIVVL
ncbi:hypothetical protein [Marinifilum flexuosum]|uniref:Lipoprotein n=1 Tax=Marinifilum flexuosum TaxID=1117708 RepID=A0A419WXD7_9BACT|nr:hypothetical protein [Marinifilum flexuosum]RKE00120.1 hypothetical protein BXY64_3121 [Marinifilum flexuosum]